MDCKRNRIVEISDYLNSLGIIVNIGKTKARGNRGVFIHSRNGYRIDIAKNLSEEEQLSAILHEFAHYVHYKYDKTLQTLDFIFGDNCEKVSDELVNITVKCIPKKFATDLFEEKSKFKKNISALATVIRSHYPKFVLSQKFKPIENKICLKYKYLLKYDRVNVFGKIYSVDNIYTYSDLDEYSVAYIQLRQQQRFINRINSKITKLNKYYSSKSELFARFIENYFLDRDCLKSIAPESLKLMDSVIKHDLVHEFCIIDKILN